MVVRVHYAVALKLSVENIIIQTATSQALHLAL